MPPPPCAVMHPHTQHTHTHTHTLTHTHTHTVHGQSCLTLCDPIDCSPPASSIRGFSQARILEWVASSSSRGTFPTQGSNWCLLDWQADSLPLSHLGSPHIHRLELILALESKEQKGSPKLRLPSISTRITSLRTVKVVPRTRMENRKVQMGSINLYSGYKEREVELGVTSQHFSLPSPLPPSSESGRRAFSAGWAGASPQPCRPVLYLLFCVQKDRQDVPQFRIRHMPPHPSLPKGLSYRQS